MMGPDLRLAPGGPKKERQLSDESGGMASTPESMLAAVPQGAAVYLRDLIKGLEAEAGTARAIAAGAARRHQVEAERLRARIASLESQLAEVSPHSRRRRVRG